MYTRATALGGFVLAVCMMHSFRAIVHEQLNGRKQLNETLSERHREEQMLMVGLAYRTRPSRPEGPPSLLFSRTYVLEGFRTCTDIAPHPTSAHGRRWPSRQTR